MLKYQLSSQVFDNDIVNINYSDFSLLTYENDPENFMWVTLLCDDVNGIKPGDMLNIVSTFTYFNDLTAESNDISDSMSVPVSSVDFNSGTVSFIADKYKALDVNNVKVELEYDYIPYQYGDIISNGTEYYYFNSLNYTYVKKIAKTDIVVPEDNSLYFYVNADVRPRIVWVFDFDNTHYFNADEDISLTIQFDNNNFIEITNLFYIDFQTLGWVYYDETVTPVIDNSPYAGVVSEILFGSVTPNNNMDGNISRINIKREEVMWVKTANQDMPTISYNQYKVRIDIPISFKSKTDLYKEGNINEYFVQNEEKKVINTPIEMEKYPYTPVVVSGMVNGNPVFKDCTKINFNLHFRVHDGDDWTVNDSDSWNFDKYGYNNTSTGNKYYSYAQNAGVDADQWKRSCQSDLLTYVGFTTNDVKYQKNKLKKTFIRLSYYDSDDPGEQNLLAYSTIFVDCNKLYSKFISRMNFNCYFNSDGDIVKGIKVDREVNTSIPPDSLAAVLGVKSLKPEEIEESRLSSQISVKNRYISNNSSEGFYLYTWELNDIPTIPADVYLKVEFNHAGYGRNIPMMAPYITKTERDDPSQGNPYYNKTGFKTNADIAGDWNGNRQYGIKRYTRYSYIHFKAKYDTNTKRHIYYLDPDTYGTKYDWDKSVLNINLYEARIAFD